MINLNDIAEDLFNKIRSRYSSVTMGDDAGKVTNDPALARFIDFEYKSGSETLGHVNVSLSEDDGLVVYYSTEFVSEENDEVQKDWYNFLRELRMFSKKRMLNFDTRDITKSNLDKRDYQFLAKNSGDNNMTESKLYGTPRTSYQDLDGAKLLVKHSKPVNSELPGGRSMHIESIFIESPQGERFKYPVKHLNGARALGRHIANGGTPYDAFGNHIVEMSKELGHLRKFKNYVSRSETMSEAMGNITDRVVERIEQIKKSVDQLQKQSYYNEAFESFKTREISEVPEDVRSEWVEALTVKSFKEELQDVFPYLYNVLETQELNPEDFSEGSPVDDVEVGLPAETYTVQQGDTLYSIYMKFKDANFQGHGRDEALQAIMDENPEIKDPSQIRPGMEIKMPYFMGSGPDGATRGLPPGGFQKYGEEIESALNGVTKKYEIAEGDAVFSQDEEEQAMAIKKLQALVGDHFPAGVDGTNAIESLHGLIDDPRLHDMLKQIGQKDSDMCVRPLVNKYIKAKDPQLLAKLDFGDMEASETDVTVGKDGALSLDGDEEQKTPLGEFILSYYDRQTGQFPKGETAVLTAVEKDYGNKCVPMAQKFIEAVHAKYEQFTNAQLSIAEKQTSEKAELDRIKGLAGIKR